MEYVIHRVQTPDWQAVPSVELRHTGWLSPCPITAQVQACHDGKHLFVRMEAVEAPVRATLTGPLDQVCDDSCLEFFFAPLTEDARYLNFECNPLGNLYLGFGAARDTRVRQVVRESGLKVELGGGIKTEADVDAEAAPWRAAGYPAPPHSQAYRALYHPAYRLVPAAAERFLPLFQAIDALLAKKGSARIAIDGNSGAGKSTLGALLAAAYGGNLYHMDDFFLPPGRKTAARLAEPGGNVDWERFSTEVLAHLGAPFSYRPWRCHPGVFAAPVTVLPRAVEIAEGVYSMHPALRSAYDLGVFLSVTPDEQVRRIRARSGEAMLKRFVDEWIPLENAYFERLGVRACCQLAFEAAG